MNAPVQLPRLAIELDGAALPAPLAANLLGLRVQQRLSLPALCELRFVAAPGAAQPAPGAALRVAVAGHAEALFEGSVTAIDDRYGPGREREWRVRAYDALHALRQRQSVRVHLQQTLPSLARELASDLGLTVDSEADGPVWQRLVQAGSDFDLLADVARRCGMAFTLRGTKLHLLSLAGIGAPVPLEWGATLLEARVETNLDGACSAVTCSGWDPWRAGAHGGRADSARCPERARPNGAARRTLVGLALQDEGQAEALAQSVLDRSAARACTLWGIAEGDPALRPGCVVAPDGLAPASAGHYVLAEVIHTVDPQRGFQSELSSALPPAPPQKDGAACTLGIVTRVDDPERLGRIQATLPAFCDVETDWLAVLAPGAGKGKGLLALPDVGDVVLLLLAAHDPSQAVVLGGLFAEQGLPQGDDVVGKDASFSFLSPGGHKLRLDDGKRLVRIEDSAGSFLELSPDRVRLHAAATLEIGAPGQQVFIRGRNIDFERT